MLTRRLAAFLTLAFWALLTPTASPAAADGGVADLPVSFTVRNVNRSAVPCPTDGRTYTVRGHLTGPAEALRRPGPKSVTLYLHGLELGEWFWRAPAAGYHHSHEMARRGHISVTIDRLGYGDSGHPAGIHSCVGAHADVAHQIVQQLRAGSYDAGMRPQFSRVALVGHSLGGAIAELEAISFGDIDAVGVVSYGDLAVTLSTILSAAVWGPGCLLGGQQSDRGAPGYAFLTRDVAEYRRAFLAQTPPGLLPYAVAGQSLNPCGDMNSFATTAAINGTLMPTIRVPVLYLTGDRDLVFDHERVTLQASLAGAGTTASVVAGATHGITLEPTSAAFRASLSAWLTRHAF